MKCVEVKDLYGGNSLITAESADCPDFIVMLYGDSFFRCLSNSYSTTALAAHHGHLVEKSIILLFLSWIYREWQKYLTVFY